MTKVIKSMLSFDKSKWTRVRLDSVAREVRQVVRDAKAEGIDRIVGLEHIDSEDIHLRKWIAYSEETTFSKKFVKGQVLFGRRRAYLKKAALATFDGVCSGDITVLEAKDGLIPELLPFLINNDRFFDYAVKKSAGSLSPRAKFKDLADYEFLLPPKDQQARLAELLWAGDEVVNQSIEMNNKIQTLKSAKRHELLSTPNLATARLIDHAIVKGRIGWKGLKQSEYVADGPFLVAGKHIANGSINWDKCDHITEERYIESPEIALEIGDIIFSKDGSIGNPALIDMLPGKATINSTMMLIRPSDSLNSKFFFQLMQSPYFEKLVIEKISGTAIPHIFQADMQKFSFPLPPIDVQIKISNILEQLDKTTKNIGQQIEAARMLQKAMINLMF